MTHMRSHPLPETDPVAGGVSALRAGDPPRDEMSQEETEACHLWQLLCVASDSKANTCQTGQVPSRKSSKRVFSCRVHAGQRLPPRPNKTTGHTELVGCTSDAGGSAVTWVEGSRASIPDQLGQVQRERSSWPRRHPYHQSPQATGGA
uniref:Uncharacterized protein n=1 Tax=Eutreptiella gymnastica TaxID=73025 RepID=A0A7S1NGY5_9EUGL